VGFASVVRPSAVGLVLVLACAALGCSPGDVSAAERSRTFELLRLEADPPRPPQASEVVLRLTPDSTWTSQRGELRLVGDADAPERVLAFSGPKRTALRIPRPLDPTTFNAVVLDIELPEKRELTLQFISDDGATRRTYKGWTRPEPGRQRVSFALPDLEVPLESVDWLRLSCALKIRDARLHAIELIREPLNVRLAAPADGGDLVLAGSEQRRGVGLAAGLGIRARLRPQASSELRFSFAAPGRSAEDAPGPVLVLEWGAPGGEQQQRRFEPALGTGYAWSEARVPLGEFAGQELDLHWSVEGDETGAPWALAECGVVSGTGPARRVLLITSDTHRADHLGEAGSGVEVRTPVLDAFARRGVLFEDCFASTNITNPSHIALMTATHPRDTGVLSNHEPISVAAPTLAEAFEDAGFATYASISSRHLGDRTSGLGQGFQRLATPLNLGQRDGAESIDDLLRWLERADGLPTFVWLHLYDAHVPYDPPAELVQSYYPEPRLAFDPEAPEIDHVPARVYDRIFPGLKDLEYPKALYAGEVSYLDGELQRVLEHPAFAEATIAFTADHGESLGAHGVFFAHADLYPDSLHIPLILSGPGVPRGVRCEAPVSHTDLGRTLLDLVGHFSAEFPGSNVLDQIDAPAGEGNARYAIGAGASMASITEDGWHLILALQLVRGHHRVDERAEHSATLHHLESDPGTMRDLLTEESERAAALRAKLIAWLGDVQDRGWRSAAIVDPETLRSLEALGYTATDSAASDVLFDANCDCDECRRFAR